MIIEKQRIPDVLLIKPKQFEDERGFFYESYNKKEFDSVVGKDITFFQDNFSYSKYGVLRGIHLQKKPFSQGKLVRVTLGEVFDVAVDLRENSPFYLQWVSAVLSEENRNQLWIPEGFGHGFLTLSEEAHFNYKTTSYYEKSSEKTILWNDPKININWPEIKEIKISDKDALGENID